MSEKGNVEEIEEVTEEVKDAKLEEKVKKIENTNEATEDVEPVGEDVEPVGEDVEPVGEDVEEIVETDVNDSIFITEDDTFDIITRWYRTEGELLVEGDSDVFDKDFDGQINEFTATFKYPSQGDYELVQSSTNYKSVENMSISDIVRMEVTRLVTLVRKWTLKKPLDRMIELDPSIVKGLLSKVRDEIGMKAIL